MLPRCTTETGRRQASRPYSEKSNSPGEVRVFLPGVPLVNGLHVQDMLPKYGLLTQQLSKVKFALINLENAIDSGNWERFFTNASKCQGLFAKMFSYQEAMNRSDYETSFDPIMKVYSSFNDTLRVNLDDAFSYLKTRVSDLSKFSIEERREKALNILGILNTDALALFNAFGGGSKKRYSPITILDIGKLEAKTRAVLLSEDEPLSMGPSVPKRSRSFSLTTFRPIAE